MIQIDIDMPKRCEECPLCVDYDCIIHERITDEYYDTLEEQYAHCPLTMPSAQSDIAENLYLYKCYITDKDGLQHEVIHTGDIRRVTGWKI